MSDPVAIPPDGSVRLITADSEPMANRESPDRFRYLPFLDGLRAISILLVLAFHGLGPISIRIARTFAGWAGVDIFFVVSGFLITSILQQEQTDCGSFSLRRFYARRTLRIWPAYYAFLAVIGLTAYSNWKSIGICSIYLTNFDLALGWNVLERQIGHLWSLAVEEQFYLLWPFVLILAGRWVLPLSLGLIAAVWSWRTILLIGGASWLRLCAGFDTRLDAILLGCVAAMIWARPELRAKFSRALSGNWTPSLLVIATVASAAALGHPSERQTLPAQLMLWDLNLPLFTLLTAALLLALILHPRSRVTRFLSHPLLVWLGRLSYSLYLWHVVAFKIWPKTEIAFLRSAFPDWPLLGFLLAHLPSEVGRLLLSVAFASTSYYLIERPFLALKKRWESNRLPVESSEPSVVLSRPTSQPSRRAA